MLKRTDFESNSRVRGQDKVGGMLAPIEAKVAESRARRPIRPNLSGDMESSRLRKKLVLTEKMAAIETLRQAIVVQRQALDDYDAESVHSTYSTFSHSKSQGSSRPKVDQLHPNRHRGSNREPQTNLLQSPNIEPLTLPLTLPLRSMTDSISAQSLGQGSGLVSGFGLVSGLGTVSGTGSESGVMSGSMAGVIQRSPRLLYDAIAAGRAQTATGQSATPSYSTSTTNIPSIHSPKKT